MDKSTEEYFTETACENFTEQEQLQTNNRKEENAVVAQELFDFIANIIQGSQDTEFQAMFVQITGENNLKSALVKLREKIFKQLKINQNRNDTNQLMNSLVEIESISCKVFSSTLGMKRISTSDSLGKDLALIAEMLNS